MGGQIGGKRYAWEIRCAVGLRVDGFRRGRRQKIDRNCVFYGKIQRICSLHMMTEKCRCEQTSADRDRNFRNNGGFISEAMQILAAKNPQKGQNPI